MYDLVISSSSTLKFTNSSDCSKWITLRCQPAKEKNQNCNKMEVENIPKKVYYNLYREMTDQNNAVKASCYPRISLNIFLTTASNTTDLFL